MSATATRTLSIDWAHVGDTPAVQRFLDEHWRAGHILARDRTLLDWQFQHPDGDRRSILLAWDRGELAGLLGVIQSDFFRHGHRQRAGWLANWIVPPHRRSPPVGLLLLRRAIESFDVLGTIGGNATTQGILRSLGFDVRAAMPRYVRVLHADAFQQLLRSAGAESACDGIELSAGSIDARVPAGWSLAEPTPSNLDNWDRAWGNPFAPGFVGSCRNADFLRWRYLNHPTFEYHVRFAVRPDQTVAGMVAARRVSIRDLSTRVVRIVDFLSADATAARVLMSAVAPLCEDPLVAFVDTYTTSRTAADYLVQLGFLPEESMPMAVPSRFQPLDGRPHGLSVAIKPAGMGDDVYLTCADGDQDRPN